MKTPDLTLVAKFFQRVLLWYNFTTYIFGCCLKSAFLACFLKNLPAAQNIAQDNSENLIYPPKKVRKTSKKLLRTPLLCKYTFCVVYSCACFSLHHHCIDHHHPHGHCEQSTAQGQVHFTNQISFLSTFLPTPP